MQSYHHLAKHYDQWMDQAVYSTWIPWLLDQIKLHQPRAVKVLEFCCGTGRVTFPLARVGYSVTAVDISEDMLAVAQQQSEDLLNRIRWMQGDMLKLTLRDRFDVVACVNDGLNYLDSKEDLVQFFKVCYDHLRPGGLLLFDLSSPYKLKHILGDKTIAETFEDSAYIWENHYSEEEGTLEFDFTIFELDGNGRYQRRFEQHRQRSFEREEVEEAADLYFETVETFGDDFKAPAAQDQRFYYIYRRKI